MSTKGFTLIELLVAMAIIGIVVSITIFGLDAGRKNSRDLRRKTDLEYISSGMARFYADCGAYLSDSSYDDRANAGHPLTGIDWIARDLGKSSCVSSNVYLQKIPLDPMSPQREYEYHAVEFNRNASWMVTKYVLCAALEDPPDPVMDTSQCVGGCGSGVSCNYIIKSF